MNSRPPFIGQERSETCMLACLRMLLAYQGKDVSEATLLAQASLEEGGIDPDQLAALAVNYELKAEARQIDLDEIADLVRENRFPIVLVDRSFLDGEFTIHAVIPVQFSRHYVTVLDPLRGQRRISKRKFALAHRRVDRWTVVWSGEEAENAHGDNP
jgi:ABC-type bacteriocin/lantibiotic exporter with double-glycine peptidase domain